MATLAWPCVCCVWMAGVKLSRTRGKQEEHLFWQSGGGYDRNVTNAKTLLSVIDYLDANPVREGIGGTSI